MKKTRKRKSHLLKFLMILILLVFVWWFNNYTLKVSQARVSSPMINDEITIVQLTDLHGASFGYNNSRLLKKIEKISPDLVFITGDMYTYTDDSSGEETAFNLMRDLAQKYSVYYVNGEHDNKKSFFERLEAAGVNVFNYEEEIITVKQTKLHLYGIDNVYYSQTFDLINAFEKDEENFSILLAHIQNFERFASFGIDLSVCGDTHGEIFRLPIIGAVYSGEKFFPDLNLDYTKGLYSLGESQMFISSGLGAYPIPVRFYNRPEVAVIKLTPQSEGD